MIKQIIRQWLGHDEIIRALSYQSSSVAGLHAKTNNLIENIEIHNLAIARLLTKIDPFYGVSELDPERRKQSDALGEAIIARLRAEHAVIQEKGHRP